MRILSVCSNFRVFGAETITLKMLEGFKQNGHEQLAVTSFQTDGEFSRRLDAVGVPEVKLPFGAIALPKSLRAIHWTAYTLSRLPALWLAWARLMREFNPDVVVFTGSRQCLLLYPWLARQPSFLIEFTGVETSVSNRRLYRMLSPKLSCFVAVSDFMREHLHRLGAPVEKIRVIKSGAFFEREQRATEQAVASFTRTNDGPFRIGFVGQVAPTKGHDCLVEAVRLLRERGNNLLVQIFGSGDPEYVKLLKDRIAGAKLTNIWIWMGYERDKAKIFGSMDVCVVPSCFGDPFPTVAMEAGVYGLPVVASRIGGLPEIIEDGMTGILVDANVPEQLANGIERLIRDPALARAMGAAGRERVFRDFTVEKMVGQFEELFQREKLKDEKQKAETQKY